MTDTLKVLHLEDDPLDTELTRELLTSSGFRVQIDRVDSLPSFRERLGSGDSFDLILSDFCVPGTDIHEAIRTSRHLRPATPLIILSGTLGEEKAIEMFHLGASDYVLKQRMGRLPQAIRRALREAEEQARRVAAEEALLAAKEAAEAGNRAKDRFLLTISHELRTPLTVIMGMQDLALSEELPPQARSYLGAARKSSEMLLALISDILDFSGIEKGQTALEEKPFDLHESLRQVIDSFVAPAREKNLTLSLALAPGLPSRVLGDRRRLQQIVRNLLGNAVRFTQEGRIDIEAGRGEGDDGSDELTITVRDTGIGIPDEALGYIFDRFSQADMSLTRRFGGAGLGLAISQGLVERMGGKVSVQSRVGEGSLFTVTVPLRYPEATSPSLSPEVAATPRILVAEDDPMIGEMMTMILKKEGWEAKVVTNGKAALDEWESGRFRMVLLDLQMPAMNGLDAARAIRHRENGGGRLRTPIIALTAHAREQDRQACLDAGMDAFLTKPLQVPKMLETIRRVLG